MCLQFMQIAISWVIIQLMASYMQGMTEGFTEPMTMEQIGLIIRWGLTIGQIYKLGQSQTFQDKIINGFQDNGTYTHLANRMGRNRWRRRDGMCS